MQLHIVSDKVIRLQTNEMNLPIRVLLEKPIVAS
jgi:hypothetical protein